ncbi:MAG TPA: caspase family protein [Burkholderiales bacterium]|jgi:uncharacterized caspase-like protein
MTEPLPTGAHLVTPRGWYEHHGIYAGDGRVVHYAGYCGGLHTGPVEEIGLEEFCSGRGFELRVHVGARYSPAEIVERARSRIGEQRYDLLANNCEHFCEWAIMGRSCSVQVERFLSSPLAWVRRIVGGALLGSALALAAAAQGTEAAPPPPAVKAATGERRVALVIGNARYPGIPLNNPENDARAMGATLRGLGFEVTEHLNLPVRKFRQVLRDYVRTLQNTDGVGLLYYAGHGVQIDGRNYLLPVDINLRDEEEIKDEAVDIDDLFVSKLEHAKTRGLIVILDACRDNPFKGKTRNIQAAGGLAEMGARGALIAYSAAPGATAEDGPEGGNGVFTRHLVREMQEQGVEVETMFKSVRVKVLRDTNKRQMPWVNSSLTVDFQFKPQAPHAPKEDLSQEELKRLQALLDRREQQRRELEAQVKALRRERVAEAPRVKPAAKPAVETQLQRCVWCFPASSE